MISPAFNVVGTEPAKLDQVPDFTPWKAIR